MTSVKVQKLADKINSTLGAREVVIPILEGKFQGELKEGDNFSIVPVSGQAIEESDSSQIITSLDEMSKTVAGNIEKMGQEIKKLSQMLQDAVNNNAEYHELDKKVKEIQKQRTALKAQIMRDPSLVKMSHAVKKMRAEKKEKQLALSDYLIELERMTGANQLELFDGSIYEIQKTAKLVKKARFER